MMFAQTRQRHIVRRQSLFTLIFLSYCLTGCVTVPKATVEASHLVGERLSDLQMSHEATLRVYFDLTRERVEDFLVNRWIPVFLSEFMNEAVMAPVLNTQVLSEEEVTRLGAALDEVFADTGAVPDVDKIVLSLNKSLGAQDRGEAFQLIITAANTTIAEKRQELLAPIDVLEREALGELRAAYVDVFALQSSLTSYLQSLSDVTLTRDEILNELGLLQQRDKVLTDILNLNDELEAIINAGGDVKNIIEQIKELLSLANPSGPVE
jgi:hypothetical protein